MGEAGSAPDPFLDVVGLTMARRTRYVLCVENRGHSASLDLRRVYRVVADTEAEERDLLRVIDESGEDYLYPSRYFLPIDLPRGASRVFGQRSA